MPSNRVVVLMSGGVDSSVAAYILKERGFEVYGLSLQLFHNEKHSKDLNDAQRVATQLGIPHDILDVSEYFRETIIDYFVREYLRGRTPNPCAFCNRLIKTWFGLDFALSRGFDYIATGHYAVIARDDKGVHLKRAVWPQKAQEYYLALLDKLTLEKLLLPLGELSKEQVKRIAHELGLPIFEKSESQEVCFIKGDYRDFLKEQGLEEKEGLIKDKNGYVLGRHRGYYFYTIGQRRGLGLPMGKRLYVQKILPEENLIIVGGITDVKSYRFMVENFNLIEDVREEFVGTVRVRYRGEEAPCRVRKVGNRLEVDLEKALFAVTPGQIAVFYKGDTVIGGGVICEVS
ncbi:MAG: tRNA 2-thiouridine(34) synthase MnmA [candidate division WOR-3 bacterium]